MPVHDWSGVIAGYFHAFHQSWSMRIQDALNAGRLPDSFYALVEQKTPRFEPDILTLEVADLGGLDEPPSGFADDGGGAAVLTAPPRAEVVQRPELSEAASYARKANRITVRHVSGDRPVASIEIVSPGNKDGDKSVDAFCRKSADLIASGRHLSVVDVLRPTASAPDGMHAELWRRCYRDDSAATVSPERPVLTVAYNVSKDIGEMIPEAFVTTSPIGEPLPDLPLFIQDGRHVLVPLAETYERTWEATPKPVKDRILGRR